ncbi:hypothetical protein BJV82DRAFT_612156 [Fennellomyces sp. T-0311]|nr:hypothetical protein BJV82DRAFT_612156 [Fennellomyces sp. T-0311]
MSIPLIPPRKKRPFNWYDFLYASMNSAVTSSSPHTHTPPLCLIVNSASPYKYIKKAVLDPRMTKSNARVCFIVQIR